MPCSDQLSQLTSVIQGGQLFDDSMITRLSDVTGEISTIQGRLTSAGLTDLAAQLNSFDVEGITNLGSFVSSQQSSIIEDMSDFSAISAVSDTSSITDAFGPVLQARSMCAAMDSINSMLDSSVIDSSVIDEITGRITQMQSIPSQVPALISAQSSYFETGRAILASASESSQIASMFQDDKLKIVLGAIGSDELMAALKC